MLITAAIAAAIVALVLDLWVHRRRREPPLAARLVHGRVVRYTDHRALDGRTCALCGHHNLARAMVMTFDRRRESLVWRCPGCESQWRAGHA